MRVAKMISLLIVACLAFAVESTTQVQGQTAVFEGALLITGDGGTPIENSAFMVEGNRFTAVGRRGAATIPAGAARVDLSGKTVIPALIDAHVHMGYRKGLSFGPENYTRENLLDILNRFAYYGVAAILETGTARGDLAYQLRAETPPARCFAPPVAALACPMPVRAARCATPPTELRPRRKPAWTCRSSPPGKST